MIEDIITLIKAGYTKDEINGMLAGSKPEEKQPEQPEVPEEKKEEKPQEKQPEKKEASSETYTPFVTHDEYGKLLEAMQQLTAGIIKTNINKDGFDNTPEKTAESALAAIINPAKKG